MTRLIGLIALSFLVACSAARPVTEVQSIDPLLSSLNKGTFPAELRGKVVLVDIWASWCQPCTESLPFLSSLRDELNSKDLEIVTVNVDADKRASKAFLKELGLDDKLAVLNDPEAKQVEKTLGIIRLPTTLFVDRTGRVRFVESGFFNSSKDTTRDHVKQLLAEKSPMASAAR